MMTFGLNHGIYTFGLLAPGYAIHYSGINCLFKAEDGNEFEVQPGTNFVTIAPEYFEVGDFRDWIISQEFYFGIVNDPQIFVVDESRTWVVDPADLLTETEEDDYTVSEEDTFTVDRECDQ